ncbi:hypothetical protein IHE33_02595 [Mycetohabitans endofungorum]|uniref:hypothetical protein n=1 Tax=Mycetohabitans endofungorum TaxID=417203 RepID=UPI0030D5C9FD
MRSAQWVARGRVLRDAMAVSRRRLGFGQVLLAPIGADGRLPCDGQPVDTAQLSTRFVQAAREPVPAQLERRAETMPTRYESIAGV